MTTISPYDLVIGLDRSDTKVDLCLIDAHTGDRRTMVIATTPEALWEWLFQLRQQHPQARVGLCLEQPAVHLIPFLEAYAWITLHPINPITLQKYREALVSSRAKDDTKDAEYLADLLLTHHSKLPGWFPEDSGHCNRRCPGRSTANVIPGIDSARWIGWKRISLRLQQRLSLIQNGNGIVILPTNAK